MRLLGRPPDVFTKPLMYHISICQPLSTALVIPRLICGTSRRAILSVTLEL
jgi:hypothetical protein